MRTYWGFSSGWKPTPSNIGDLFLETDTCREYEYSSLGEWNLTVSLKNIITGGTYDVGTQTLSLVQFNGCPINITGIGGGSSSIFTGGTVTGPTNFLSGVTANTLSVVNYLTIGSLSRTGTISGNCAPGTTTLISASTTNFSHRSIHVKYVIDDGTNMRAGNFILVSDGLRGGSNFDYVDTSTNDIGNTSNYILRGSTSGGFNNVVVENYGVSSVNIFIEYTLI